jgi:hypothetical protein
MREICTYGLTRRRERPVRPSLLYCFKMAVNRLIHDGRGVPTSGLRRGLFTAKKKRKKARSGTGLSCQ